MAQGIQRRPWLKVALLAVLPVALYFFMAAKWSWQPRTLKIGKAVTAMSWSADSITLVLGITEPIYWKPHHYDEVQLWDVNQRLLRRSIPVHNLVDSRLAAVSLAPNNTAVAILMYAEGHFMLTLWDADTSRLLASRYGVGPLVFSTDSRQIQIYDRGEQHVRRAANEPIPGIAAYAVQTGRELHYMPLAVPPQRSLYGYCTSAGPDPDPTWTFSSNGKLGALGLIRQDSHPPHYWAMHGGVLLFDARAGKRKYLFPATFPNADCQCGTGTSLVFSPDGKLLAIGEASGDTKTAIQLCNTQTGQRQLILSATKDYPIAFSPDHILLLSSNGAKVAHLWNTQTGQLVATLHGNTGGPFSFSPDGALLASGGYDEWDNRALLWNPRTGERLRTLIGHAKGCNVTHIAFSPDGTTLATGSTDGTVKLWRIK